MHSIIMIPFFLCALLFGFRQDTTISYNQTSDFAIYLLKDQTIKTWDAIQLPLTLLILADRPLISINDIVSYNWSQHSLTLTGEGIKKVGAVIVNRRSTFPFPFIVVVGNERVYLGNIFMTSSSYIANDIPYIFSSFKTTLIIYRSPNKNIVDKRSDKRVYKALLKSKKLK